MRILTSTFFTMAALAALGGVAFAKPGNMPRGGADPHHPAAVEQTRGAGPGTIGMMSGMDCPMMGGHPEGALAFLKTELKINQAQGGVWDSFAATYRDVAASLAPMARMGGGMMGSGGMMGPGSMMGPGQGGPMMGAGDTATEPYLDRMASRMRMMEARLAAMTKLQDGVSPLYMALNAEQKKVADRLLPMFTMMGGGMM